MEKELTLPGLGENIEKVQVSKLSVEPGDTVEEDQALMEVEADKAVVEVPANQSGTLKQFLVSEGDTVKVGDAFAVLEVEGDKDETDEAADSDEKPAEDGTDEAEDSDEKPAEDGTDEAEEQAEEEEEQEEEGEEGEEGEEKQAEKKSGKKAAPDRKADKKADKKPEKKSEKKSEKKTDTESESDKKSGKKAEPDKEPEKKAEKGAPKPSSEDGGRAGGSSARPHVPAAPSVRRFAREIGIDVDTVKGSGPHGRVSVDDVKQHARELNAKRRQPGGTVVTPALPDFSKWGDVHREPMSSIREATAKQVTRCWLNIPRVTHFDSADITQLEMLRKRYKERAAKGGGNLTMAVMVVKVVAEALRKFPSLNASIDMESNEIIYKDYVNIGIAVATERGLLVPVIRNADQRNMVQLAADIDTIAKRCREGKVTREELQGGTFTVTNLGSIGGSFFTPIVNWPEVGILGMGRAADQVKMEDGEPSSRVILPLSLSYDHRLVDGADAARFVRWIAEAVEEPLLLSLEGGAQ